MGSAGSLSKVHLVLSPGDPSNSILIKKMGFIILGFIVAIFFWFLTQTMELYLKAGTGIAELIIFEIKLYGWLTIWYELSLYNHCVGFQSHKLTFVCSKAIFGRVVTRQSEAVSFMLHFSTARTIIYMILPFSVISTSESG